jgi:SAM-dependent methyltransferase
VTTLTSAAAGCPVCHKPNGHARTDYRDEWPGSFQKLVYRCRECRSAYVHPLPDLDTLSNLYSDKRYHDGGLPGFGYESGPNPALGDLEIGLLESPPTGRFLDVGAGHGVAATAALARGWSVTALDYERPDSLSPEVVFLVGDPMSSLASLPAQGYELAFLLQVVEHPLDPENLLKAVARVLTPNGRCLITTPNGVSLGHRSVVGKPAFKKSREHLWFFSTEGLTSVAQRAGLEVERVTYRGGVGLGTRPAGDDPVAHESSTGRQSVVSGVITKLPPSWRAELCMILRPSI